MKTKSAFHAGLGKYMIVIGICLSILYWIFESFIHVYIFHEGTLLGQIFSPKQHEAWMRSLAVSIIILFSVYSRFLLLRPGLLEESLSEVGEKYKTLFENAKDGVVLIDRETGQIVDCNPEFERQAGRNLAGLKKIKIWELRPPDKVEVARKKFFEVKKSGVSEAYQLEFQKPDGEIVPVEFVSKAVELKGRHYLQSITRNIAERKKAEESLRGSERFLQNVFDSIQDGVSVLDSDLNIVRVNRWINKMYGDNSKIVGKKCYRIYQKKDSICPWCPSLKALETGEVQSEVVPYPSKEEPVGWLYLSSYPLRDVNDNVVGVIEYVKDITDLKKTEEALRVSEASYRTIFNTASDGILLHDPETGNVVDVNQRLSDMTGYTREEILQLKIGELGSGKPSYTTKDAIRWMKRAIKEGPQIFEWEAKKKSGQTLWTEISLKKVNLSGRDQILSILRDITERKQAEEALRRSEERFRQIAENAQEWIWEVNPKGAYTYASPMAEKILGYKPEEIVGKKYFYDFFHPDEMEKLKKAAFEVFAKKDPFREFLNRNVRKDGKIIWLSTSGVPVFNEEGNFQGYRGADIDVTERRRMEQMRHNLIRDVSHSLKTPLVTTKMAVNEIEKALESDDIKKAREFQMMIRGNIDKAYRDISNILELYSLEEGRPVKLKGSISLRKALGEVILGIKDIAEYKKLKLITDIPEEADRILINEKEMNTLLFNVLDNAVKFTNKGHVAVLAKAEGEMVEIRVEDTGCGIPDEEKDKVFDKFYQRSAAVSGVGLGLSICREIVHRYNGKIEVVSEGTGKGARVIISLPKG